MALLLQLSLLSLRFALLSYLLEDRVGTRPHDLRSHWAP